MRQLPGSESVAGEAAGHLPLDILVGPTGVPEQRADAAECLLQALRAAAPLLVEHLEPLLCLAAPGRADRQHPAPEPASSVSIWPAEACTWCDRVNSSAGVT